MIPAMRPTFKYTCVCPPLAEGSSDTGGNTEPMEPSTGMEHIVIVLALIYHAIDVENTRKNALPEGAKRNAEKFGPLKIILGKIPPLFTDRTVRLRSPAHRSPLTRFSGIRCREQQGCKPPLAYNRIGGTFRFASKWRAGAETPGCFDKVRNCSTRPPPPPTLISFQRAR